MDIQRLHVSERFCEAAVYNGVVYLAGQVPETVKREEGMAAQTAEVLSLIDKYLASAGTDKSRLLTAQIFITDITLLKEMDSVWKTWVVPGCVPVRASVQTCALANPEWLLEIVVTAAVGAPAA